MARCFFITKQSSCCWFCLSAPGWLFVVEQFDNRGLLVIPAQFLPSSVKAASLALLCGDEHMLYPCLPLSFIATVQHTNTVEGCGRTVRVLHSAQ